MEYYMSLLNEVEKIIDDNTQIMNRVDASRLKRALHDLDDKHKQIIEERLRKC